MKSILVVMVSAALVLVACTPNSNKNTMENKSNKNIVAEAYKFMIKEADTSLVDTYVSDKYLQHSPMVKDGKEGLIQMLNIMKTLPKAGEGPSPIVRIIGEKDLVVVHLELTLMGKNLAIMDLFRVENGKLAEHWDVMQEIEEKPIAGDGSEKVGSLSPKEVEKNRELVDRYFTEMEENPGFAGKSLYSEKCIFHYHPFNDHSLPGIIKVHRVVAEGEFVFVQAKGDKAGKQYVFNFIQRIQAGKVVEEWMIRQEIPTVMAHSNGMI